MNLAGPRFAVLPALARAAAGLVIALGALQASAEKPPVYLGLNLEFGHATSTSDDAIRAGARIAVEEINRAGGVLGGRPLAILERDDRSVPARSLANIKELAAHADVVAIFCGKFSPVALESLPLLHELKMPLLNPWAAADAIIDNGFSPSYAFRLSLRDTWAMERMLSMSARRGLLRVGLMLPNTSWGRSNLKAAEAYVRANPRVRLASVEWYNWGEPSLAAQYGKILESKAQLLVLVANEKEGSLLVKEMADRPPAERLPILSHWGVTGGEFFQMTRGSLDKVDFAVVQTYSFLGDRSAKSREVAAAARRLLAVERDEDLPSPVGIAHAYDLTHILARAIDLAGTTDREAVRAALEKVRDYGGLVKRFPQPFSRERHEALDASDVFLARYQGDGSLRRVSAP